MAYGTPTVRTFGGANLALRTPAPALVTRPQVVPFAPVTGGARVAVGLGYAGQPSPVPVAQTAGNVPGNNGAVIGIQSLLPLVSPGAYGQPAASAAGAYVGPPVTVAGVTISPLVLLGGLALVGLLVFRKGGE